MSADHQVASPDHSLSIEEAAESMSVSPATIRRRIKTGELAAFKRTTPYGFEWRIGAVPESIGLITTADHVVESPDHQGVESADQTPEPEAVELRYLVEQLTQRNEQLAGQLGFTQAKLQEAERTVALLMAPKDEPAPEPPAQPEPKVSWWRRLFS